MKVLTIKEGMSSGELQALINAHFDCLFIHFEHAKPLEKNENLITRARQNSTDYDILITLTNNGFYLYMVKEGTISSFVQHKHLSKLWEPVKNGVYDISSEGVVYTLEKPELSVRNLLVMFSSIGNSPYSSSLGRYYTQNFPTIGKYISKDTAILRIADVGSVVGAFYLNTIYADKNEIFIQQLIKKIMDDLAISPSHVTLYGGSKGGTGALYHSFLGGYRCLAVDPILCDRHYEVKYNDLHFTKNIYPESKRTKFTTLSQALDFNNAPQRHIVTSIYSPQFAVISDVLLDTYGHHFTVFNSQNSLITGHTNVSAQTIHLQTMSLNALLNGIELAKKHHFVI